MDLHVVREKTVRSYGRLPELWAFLALDGKSYALIDTQVVETVIQWDFEASLSSVIVTIRARLKGHLAIYSTNRCIPPSSPFSIFTELSTLNHECLQERILAATPRSILRASINRLNTHSCQYSYARNFQISGIWISSGLTCLINNV